MFSSTIRGRAMQVVLAAAALAALLVGGVALALLGAELVAQVEAANRDRAEAVASHLGAVLGDGRGVLERVAAEAGKRPFTAEGLESILGPVLAFVPTFDSIYAYDRAGSVVLRRYPGGSEGGTGRSRSLDEKADPVFVDAALAAMSEGVSRLLPVRISPAGHLFLPCLVPVRGPAGEVVGLLSGAISTAGRGLGDDLRGLAPGASGWVGVLGPDYRILAMTEKGPGVPGAVFPVALPEVLDGLELGLPGGPVLAAGRRSPEIGLTVLVGLPRAEALAALPAALIRMGLAMLGALALAAWLAAALADRVVSRFSRVIEGVRALAQGRFSYRVEMAEGSDELVELAQGVNSLAEALERTQLLDELWAAQEPEAQGPESRPP